MKMLNLRESVSGCGCCLSRRRFLASCAACAAGAAISQPMGRKILASEAKPMRIRILYALHGPVQEVPDWPNIGFDFRPVMERIEKTLKGACPNMEFVSAMANGPEAAARIVEEDKANPPDGYIVYQMNCWNRVVQTVADTGKPVLYLDFQFAGSGGFLVYTAAFLRQNRPNVAFVGSSDMEDHVAAVKCFEIIKSGGSVADFVAAVSKTRKDRTPAPGDMTCKPDELKCLSVEETLRQLREKKILAVGGGWGGPRFFEAIQKELGVPVISIGFEELNEAWKQADKDQAKEIAQGWKKSAAAVMDVSDETLEQSAAMYLAEKALLQRHGANAITINCLGGFYGGHIHAYPCMGFHELNNQGLIGACECDVRSTITMELITTMTQGRPGFISDPVLDTAKRQIIYAHCVASNRVFGPNGPTNPFQILTHSEDRQGAAVRSLMPEGYMTTTIELAPDRKQILFHQAKSVGNSLEDRACRTKLCGEPVGDIEKLFTQWDAWGWHRVTCYGDLKEPIFALADKLGWTVIEEA
ncbi:MAG: hypothetical protein WBH86_13925 [Thermogutta sp.]